jgi:Flp pilus assembly CpaE family ATPase
MIRHLIEPASTGSPRDDESATKVLLVEDNPADIRLVQETLASQNVAKFTVVHAGRLGAALERLAAEHFDVVLLDLSLPDSRGLDTLARMRRQTASVPIVVLSGLADETVAMKALREGAQDYLVKGNADGDVLARCIRFAIERHLGSSVRSREEEPRARCKMLGFLGSKGGVGATTVACSFAMALQSETKQTVLLADFDFESSVLAFLLGVQSQYSLMDALRNSDRLDASLWKSLVCCSSTGLDIITAPAPVIPEEEPVGAEQFQQVLGFLGANYQWLVADLGRGFNRHFKSVLGDLDQIYVVTTPELAALRQARWMAQSLRQPEGGGDRLRLILNDVPKRHSFSVRDFQEALGCPIWATIPHFPELREYHAGPAPLPKIPALLEAVARLADKVAGIPEEKAKGRWALH